MPKFRVIQIMETREEVNPCDDDFTSHIAASTWIEQNQDNYPESTFRIETVPSYGDDLFGEGLEEEGDEITDLADWEPEDDPNGPPPGLTPDEYYAQQDPGLRNWAIEDPDPGSSTMLDCGDFVKIGLDTYVTVEQMPKAIYDPSLTEEQVEFLKEAMRARAEPEDDPAVNPPQEP